MVHIEPINTEFPTTVQLFIVQPSAAAPMAAEFPATMQLLSVLAAAPPPCCPDVFPVTVLPVIVQLFTVPPYTPPPWQSALSPVTTHFETTPSLAPQYAPPPARWPSVAKTLV